MRTTSDDTRLIAYALGEAGATARAAVEAEARADEETRRRLATYVEIVGTSRERCDRENGAPRRVLARLTVAQRAHRRSRPLATACARLVPVMAAAAALVLVIGSGLGDVRAPHPVASTEGPAPSDALLVARTGPVEPQPEVVPLEAAGVSAQALYVLWDSLALRPSSGDTGAADSL